MQLTIRKSTIYFCFLILSKIIPFASEAEVLPAGLSQPCLDFIANLKSENIDYHYGWVQVPQNWFDQSSGKKLNIFYYSNWKKGKIPTMYFNGGPQFNSWGTLSVSEKNMSPKNIGLITIDQRGTGCSGSFPLDNSIDSVRFGSLHSSDQIVKDAEAVREKLKIKKWKIFGQSYGGTIVNRYLMIAPESIISAFSHAAAHVETMSDFYLARIEGAYELARAIERTEPLLFEKIKKVQSELNSRNDCLEFPRGKICGGTIFDAFIYHLSGFPSQLAKTFSEFDTKNENDQNLPATFDLEKVKATAQDVLAGYFADDIAAFHAIYLNEYTSLSKVLNFAEDCAMAEILFEKLNYIPADGILINECRLTKAIFANQLQLDYLSPIAVLIPRKTIDLDQVKRNLQKYKIPYYVYAGGVDGIVGQRSSIKMATIAPKSVRYRPFLSGHGGYNFEKIMWNDVATK